MTVKKVSRFGHNDRKYRLVNLFFFGHRLKHLKMTEKKWPFQSECLKILAKKQFMASFDTTARQNDQNVSVTKISQLKMTEMFQQ